MLFPGQRIGDQPIAMHTGKAHRFAPVRGGQQRDRMRRRIVELGMDIVMSAFVVHRLAGPLQQGAAPGSRG
jgi:hypothetical protein